MVLFSSSGYLRDECKLSIRLIISMGYAFIRSGNRVFLEIINHVPREHGGRLRNA